MFSFHNTLLLTALLGGAAAQAAPPPIQFLSLAQATDDDEDEAPSAKPVTPERAPTTPAPKADAVAAPPSAPSVFAANPDAQRLVSGAPLFNPNVAVHIVEQKAYSDTRKAEIVIYPAAIQVNGKFTQHIGSMGSFVYHLQENFGLQISGGYNWYSTESTFNRELVNKFSQSAKAATALLWTWGVNGGVEVSPFFGKFAFFEGTLAHFSFVLNGGVGAGGTRLLLTPETEKRDGTIAPPTYGDAGVRFMGSVGAGFRLRLGDHFAFRLEVRDIVYTARIERINGCNGADLEAIGSAKDPATAQVGGSCNLGTFTGTDEATGNKRSTTVPQAARLVNERSSDVLNNIGLYLGISFLF